MVWLSEVKKDQEVQKTKDKENYMVEKEISDRKYRWVKNQGMEELRDIIILKTIKTKSLHTCVER